MGKNKPSMSIFRHRGSLHLESQQFIRRLLILYPINLVWEPSTDCGDYVVCTNCKDLHVTGKKMQQKKYYRHTTRPGSLKEMSMEKMKAKWGGGEILARAVRGMLPKNRLRDDRLARLKCEFVRMYKEQLSEKRF